MRLVWKILYQPYKWLIFIPIVIVVTVLCAIAAVVLSILASPTVASRVAGTAWARTLGYVTPIGVSVTGLDRIEPGRSYVVVSNHRSHYDVFVLYGWLGLDLRWVMKKELRKVPALGFACETIGHIFIDRTNRKAAIASIEAAKERLGDGTSIIFFPEGTRSRTGETGSFKKGAFRMALDLGWPLLPVTISGTRSILPSGSFDLMPGKATVQIHDPIPIDGISENQLLDLSQRVREVIVSGLPD